MSGWLFYEFFNSSSCQQTEQRGEMFSSSVPSEGYWGKMRAWKRHGWYNHLHSGAVFRLLDAQRLISLLCMCIHLERLHHADFLLCSGLAWMRLAGFKDAHYSCRTSLWLVVVHVLVVPNQSLSCDTQIMCQAEQRSVFSFAAEWACVWFWSRQTDLIHALILHFLLSLLWLLAVKVGCCSPLPCVA